MLKKAILLSFSLAVSLSCAYEVTSYSSATVTNEATFKVTEDPNKALIAVLDHMGEGNGKYKIINNMESDIILKSVDGIEVESSGETIRSGEVKIIKIMKSKELPVFAFTWNSGEAHIKTIQKTTSSSLKETNKNQKEAKEDFTNILSEEKNKSKDK
ncbi:hypothetical protein LC048_00240 [Mesobacillus subterraneus]|uniref:hypothetical protein n=1 Tax=Mesobacillus subterraneus TaxID=285983 RepID=UPI001CFDBA48|nr:hypothetical protein [Mesobacillus subterraneus]WLR55492.1 hypothetical protein LC048_00240 [Mesobacillus subterraneus]